MLHPLPKAAPSLCRTLCPPQQLAEGNLQLSCSLPLCPDLHCQGNSLVLLFPVLGSDLVETSGRTPRSVCAMGICRLRGRLHPPPDVVCGGREGGSWEPAGALCVPSSACCSGRAASQPGSLAAGLTPLQESSLSPGILTFPAHSVRSAADGPSGRQTDE